VVPSNRTRGNGHKLKYRKFHFTIKKYFFAVRGGQTLEETSQTGCVDSIFGDTQNLSGHGPMQLALVDLLSAGC